MSDDIKDLESDSLLKLIANRRIIHTPNEVIMSELSISKAKLYKTLASKEYKEVLMEICKEATSIAVLTWKSSMQSLIKEAHRVITEKLADNDLKAVEIVLKSIGVEADAPQQQQTNIQVILPDMKQPKTFEVD